MTLFSCGIVYYAVKGGSNLTSLGDAIESDHSNESFLTLFSCGTVHYAFSLDLWISLQCETIEKKAIKRTFSYGTVYHAEKGVLTSTFAIKPDVHNEKDDFYENRPWCVSH